MSAKTPASISSIPVRQLNVNFTAGFPRWWHGGEPYLSHYWNSYSMMFPRGERHTIDTVRDCLPGLEQSDRPALLADARAFIGQEAAHRRVHIEYNQVLDAQGYSNRLEPVWERRSTGQYRIVPAAAGVSQAPA